MTVRELNRDQLAELKTNYLIELGNELSYEDLININDLVSDQEVFDAYNGVNFVSDDFSSSAGDYDDTCRVVIEGANKHDIAYDLQYVADQIESGYTNGILSDGATWYIE